MWKDSKDFQAPNAYINKQTNKRPTTKDNSIMTDTVLSQVRTVNNAGNWAQQPNAGDSQRRSVLSTTGRRLN